MDRHEQARPVTSQPRPSEATRVFEGVLFDVWQWRQKLYDGSSATFETLSRPDTVLLLPVLADGLVLFGKEAQPGRPEMFRCLGGRMNKDESPENAALRELEEESGYRAAELRLWRAWQPVAKIDWAVYIYVAHQLSRSTHTALDAGERIKLQTVRVQDLVGAESALELDDYELLHWLYLARSNTQERRLLIELLDPRSR